ncbi:GntR family transcriptional regulator [Bacillaceae bacterium Marseille-Q3522]|nr:GntR family transcriptional regulator [Bacillaceae bacterium Marseille-Q3522]
MINKQSPVPIYYQLEEEIKEQIENGTLQEGDTIPSEREYAERYQISRMTVRQALTNLVNDGYLFREKGRGTFVRQQKVAQRLQGLKGFTEDMKERGLVPSSKLLSFQIQSGAPHICHQLKLAEASSVYEIKRVRLANKEPIALETTYIPVTLLKQMTTESITASIYEYAEEQLSLSIFEAEQQIEAATADKKEAAALQIKEGSPILLIYRKTFLENGVPFEFAKCAYRGDRYKFVHTLRRG